MKLNVIRTDCTNPYINLAAEEYMTFHSKPDEVTLFLWQNAHTVVIGKNQNPWKECNVEQIKADKIYLARRMSGGGAVYHDLGNLNFTFIAREGLYDIEKQTDVILLACRLLGINAVKTGRNDLTVDGRKFSGHAYYSHAGFCYHHGTIMLDVNGDDLPKYLQVSQAKLKSKGVDSVRSRVINLCEFMPGKSRKKMLKDMKDAMVTAFGRTYGGEPEELPLPEIPNDLIDKYTSEEWRLGTKIPFEQEIRHRFDWGEVDIQLHMKGSIIDDCRIYSDSLDTEICPILEELLRGCSYDSCSIRQLRLPAGASASGRDVLHLIAGSI